MRILTLAIAGLLSSTAAHAAGDALIIGNSTYNGVQTLFAATQVAETATALRDQGFDVTEANDAAGPAMFDGFGQFVKALEADDGPVVVLLAGAFLHGANGAYLLPASDGAALADAAVMVQGFPVDAALSVLAKYPGRAFLLLSESAVTADFGDFLEGGIGDLTVPAGVTVMHGPESVVSRFAASDLAKIGQPVVAAAQAAGLTVEGYAPTDLVVVRPADVPTLPASEAPMAAAESAPEVVPEAAPDTPPEPAPVAEAPAEPAPVPEAPALAEAPAAALAEEPAEVVEAPGAPALAEEPAAEVAEVQPEPAAEPEMAAEAVAAAADPVEAAPAMEAENTAEASATAEEETPEDSRSDVEIAADEGAWRAARIQNSEASYQAYLTAQPAGLYVNAATQRIKAIKSDPFYDLRRAEDFLGLDRDARRDIQRDLDVLGHYHWGVDGIFGDGTRDAVRSWQKDAGLEATGYLDLKQIATLDQAAEDNRAAEKREQLRRQEAAAAAEARRKREQAAAAAARKAEEAARQAAAPAQPARPARPSDATMWAEVQRLGSETSVRRYLQAHPGGAHARQARQMLQVIERMRGG